MLCFLRTQNSWPNSLLQIIMVALEAKYHSKCLVGLYNCAREANTKGLKDTDEKEVASGIAFAELVMYVEETRQMDEERAPVFKLNNLTQLYMSQLGVRPDVRVHTTRLKQHLLAQFSDMQAQKKVEIFSYGI